MSGATVVSNNWREAGLYYGGAWHRSAGTATRALTNPATGEMLGEVAEAEPADGDAAVNAAHEGFLTWRDVVPFERARLLREMAARLRASSEELALLDANACGNPVAELRKDVEFCAQSLDMFAGLVTELKGHSVPQGPNALSFSIREPHGVVARICPFNHPLIFTIGRAAAPLAAGNTLVVKPPEQAPLSALRAAELFDGLLPAGVLNIMPGGREFSATLVAHQLVAKVALTGSIPTGKAALRAGADTMKRVLLELGGKNPLIAFPDADPAEVAAAVVNGMNFTWCGQSCGSTSRAFIHEAIYEDVIARIPQEAKRFRPGLPTDPATTMGSLVNGAQLERVKAYIRGALDAGARLVCGGGSPSDPALANGFFLEPTVFADVTQDMAIAREEIFGPVLSIFKWSDEAAMLRDVNSVEYGLTGAIWTNDITKALKTAARVESGFIWINDVSKHALGSSFGGYKQSGLGREESLQELLDFTQEKNILVNLNR